MGDLVADSTSEVTDEQPVEANETTESEPAETARQPAEPLTREVVEKLQVAGTPDTSAEPEVDLPDDDTCMQQVASMQAGNWIELHQEQDKKFRCRLAAIIRSTGKYIFVNRSGMKVAEFSHSSLAQALKLGQAKLLDDGQLFDRALESVIGNLRTMKAGNN